jgi:protein ImuA
LLLKITNVVKFLKTMLANGKNIIIDKLQKEVLLLQGYKPLQDHHKHITGLEVVEEAFPNGVFPTGTVHEFLTYEMEHAAATGGFIGGLLHVLMKQEGICIWASTARRAFPAALKAYGIQPDKLIFIDLPREKDVMWVTEEALKCKGIAVVVAEVNELTFTQSRRLQLAVEESKVTGFILRNDPRKLCTTACVARWHITSKPSMPEEGLPGVGFPRWEVNLQRVRNGQPGKWIVEWSMNKFSVIEESKFAIRINKHIKMAG